MNGVYVIVIRLNNSCRVRIGALGSIFFEKGNYAYVGSALNGLENRIKRHLRKEKKMHWHIDYLLASENAKIARIFVKETAHKAEECMAARKIAEFGVLIENFGCWDCRCRAHLIALTDEFASIPGFSEFKSL